MFSVPAMSVKLGWKVAKLGALFTREERRQCHQFSCTFSRFNVCGYLGVLSDDTLHLKDEKVMYLSETFLCTVA